MDERVEPGDQGEQVRVYWRPGCMYCASLRRRLRRTGLAYQEINIWDDPQAAALVRSVNDGNETVPTVVVAGHAMTNPSAAQVLDQVGLRAPHLVPPTPVRRRWRWFPGARS